MVHHLRSLRPDAEFYVVPPGLCVNMKRITILDILNSLKAMEVQIEMDSDLIERARRPVDKMLALRRDD